MPEYPPPPPFTLLYRPCLEKTAARVPRAWRTSIMAISWNLRDGARALVVTATQANSFCMAPSSRNGRPETRLCNKHDAALALATTALLEMGSR